jgi:protein-L-isoaspartate(D-aspartate) O-methyltransferase
MIDSSQQRINMVDSQVRPSDITDRRIIRAMLEVPREAFVPEATRPVCYMDASVRVQPGADGAPRFLLAPRVLAKLMQAADVGDDASVLDVGCATGYSTAILARLARKVVGLEADPGLAAQARTLMREQGARNATVVEGPLVGGAPVHAPFNIILVNGAVPAAHPALLEQLKDGGRLVAVVARGGFGAAKMWRRSGRTFDERALFDAGAEPMPGFEREPGFVF